MNSSYEKAQLSLLELKAIADLIGSADDLHTVNSQHLALLIDHVARQLSEALLLLNPQKAA